MMNFSLRFLTDQLATFSNTKSFSVKTTNNDRTSHKAVMSALEVIGFSKEEINSIYQILASILLLVSYRMDCCINVD